MSNRNQHRMQLKTILNRVTNYKSFVIGKVKWAEDSPACLEVEMRPRANGHSICSGCGEKAPGYDQSRTPRRFEFVPMWMISVVFLYSHAACELLDVRRQSRAGPLGGRQEPADDGVQMVPRSLGAADVVERSIRGVPRELG